jgi:hypothetical protein
MWCDVIAGSHWQSCQWREDWCNIIWNPAAATTIQVCPHCIIVIVIVIVIIIITIIIISFMLGIHTYIPETNHVSGVYSVAATLRLLFMKHITLPSILNSFVLLY